ncbi:hypothetical protein RJT34_01755 [Clitoria ternatea]|uniref:Receptor-like serine/threonine-protein kinase n=1 Tax=Clitoria ternatea TaxID=43366 RepID=A0AAN9Q002_CLITE
MLIMIYCILGKACAMLVLTYLWLWWNSPIHVKAANDILKPGGELRASKDAQLCSRNNKYCLYFDTYGFNLMYLSISIAEKDSWRVWVANRDQPIYDDGSAVLSLDNSGVLKIESEQSEEPIVLYSSPQPYNNTVATLLDSGNFVLQQLHPNGDTGEMLWQSFDYPSDTLFPEMKLGVAHKTGQNWSLVSWLSDSIPTSGAFGLEWEPGEGELIIRRRGRVCWKSGRFMNNRFLEIPEEVQNIYKFNIVSNGDEEYLTFTTPNEELTDTEWTLLETGQLVNRKGYDIARADMCYGHNTDGGCQKWEEIPSCRDPGDVFVTKEGYPNYSYDNITYLSNASYGISDCKARCWKDCSCYGFKEYHDNGTGCVFFLLNSTQGINIASGGDSLYVLVRNNTTYQTHAGYSKKWKWKTIAMATALLIICTFFLCLALNIRKHKLKEKGRKTILESKVIDLEASNVSSNVNDLEDDLHKRHDLAVFSYASILMATNDFSSENKLGQGGFGLVYKGTLPTGVEVAVKRLSRTSGQGAIEFKNELALISELQHTNLVQLLGHCIHKQERMLVYEYMPNKSLDFFLFDSTQSKLLDWSKRFRIIEGVAQGLLYLHKYSRVKVIHRDLKASNILLDNNMSPKICDFGIARMFAHESEVNTNKIVGTIGYMSPEYLMDGVFSTKSDVYSFGVLLLEVVSGKRNRSSFTDERPLNLVGHAWELWKQGEVLQLMDPTLIESFAKDEVLKCIHVGLLCVEENAEDRPTMSNITSMLTNKNSVTFSDPKRPAYYVRGNHFEGKMTSSKEFDTDCTQRNSLSHDVGSM